MTDASVTSVTAQRELLPFPFWNQDSIFGGSGVGKSTLIGMMARGTSVDLTVLGLIGERGREVTEFLQLLGEQGRRRSVVVVSTSDQSPLLRLRAALTATAVAEYFCQAGKNVLLVVDSLTRFAMAQREIGLAAGEPPTAKGYTPSVFSLLARLVERAGRFAAGSLTAFYTVLMEGDDLQDPLVDAVRSLLDGHVVLDRALAAQGHYPPVAVLDSLSRLMPAVVSPQHLAKTYELRALLAAHTKKEATRCWTGRWWRCLQLSSFCGRCRRSWRLGQLPASAYWGWAAEMGFRFPLETVLRLRRNLEERERMRLQLLLAQRAQLELAADATRRAGRQLRANSVRGLETGLLPAIEIEFARQRERACAAEAERIGHSTRALQQQIERQQSAYVERSIGRKAIESLRERQWERYRSDMERRAQAQIEELALLRRPRS